MKTLTFLLFFLTLLSTRLFCQLEKGDWLLETGNTISFFDGTAEQFNLKSTVVTSQRAGFMLSNKVMIGTGVEFNIYNFSADLLGTFYWNRLSPFFRFYFKNNEKTAFFSGANSLFQISKTYKLDNQRTNEGIIKLELGIHHFIAPNIALETVIGTKIYEKGDLKLDPLNKERFYVNIGFKTFLNRSQDNVKIQAENFLKQGNYRLGGNAFFRTTNANYINLRNTSNSNRFDPARGIDVGLAPNIQYFKTDHWLVGSSADFKLLTTDAGYRTIFGLGIYSTYYLPLTKQLFFRPSLGMNFSRTVVNADQLKNPLISGGTQFVEREWRSIQSVTIPLSLAMTSFTKRNFIFSGGVLFQAFYFESNFRGKTAKITGEAFWESEYFFAPNLALKTTLAYYFKNADGASPDGLSFTPEYLDDRLSFLLGINYFIFREENF